ncbi:MAG: hypothetical protein JXR94_21800 [Candidatus Hydrogenedentes bacterium]|nr:hypothetical protein [Candidatus Hydrogenedentota bacterium]
MIRIEEPFHGAVLNHRHGRAVDGGLEIAVSGTAPVGEPVRVNGAYARRSGERFTATAVLDARETDIAAVAEGVSGQTEHRVRVVWDRYSKPRYRFGIDDNSFFLRDIAAQGYESLFDCFYLEGLRDLHRKYGAKFVLNTFYTTPEQDFDLSQFPASYKAEWADNADWLKLAFHAYAEFPDRPYQNCTPEKLAKDFDAVAGEIVRFAGEAAYSPPTVIHWAMVHAAAWPVLTERGVTVLSGSAHPNQGSSYTTEGESFPVAESGTPFGYDINYGLDTVRSEYLTRHDALKDFASGIVFSKTDIVCNNVTEDRIVPRLEPLTTDPNTAEIMDLFTHEQYFWPFYHNYRPDHFQRLDRAIRFCTERGYEPVFFHEGFLGGQA